MTEKTQNLQDTFLNHIRKGKTPVTVFLVNGVKLQGIITWFDNFCVLLRRDGHSQLVYKHAISTVMPVAPISLYDDDDKLCLVRFEKEGSREFASKYLPDFRWKEWHTIEAVIEPGRLTCFLNGKEVFNRKIDDKTAFDGRPGLYCQKAKLEVRDVEVRQ